MYMLARWSCLPRTTATSRPHAPLFRSWQYSPVVCHSSHSFSVLSNRREEQKRTGNDQANSDSSLESSVEDKVNTEKSANIELTDFRKSVGRETKRHAAPQFASPEYVLGQLQGIISHPLPSSDRDSHSEQPQGPSPVVSQHHGVIYVSDLPKSTTDRALRELFSKFGKVKVMQLRKNTKGMALPFAHIRYSNPAEAQAAVSGNSEHPLEIDGTPIRVEHALASKSAGYEPSSYLFLGNISPDTTESDVRELLEGWGEILRVDIVNDRAPYAFVHFPTETDVINIIKNSWEKPLVMRNHTLNALYGKPSRRGKRPSRVLFVTGYDRDVEADEIRTRLGWVARVRDLRFALTSTGGPRGFCHVLFESTKHANKVLETHKANPISIRGRPLRIAFAVERDDKNDDY